MVDETALVVLDVQVAIMDGVEGVAVPAYRRDEVLARIGDLLARARVAGAPVIFVQHEHGSFAPLMPGAAGGEIHPAVAPLAGEPVVRKQTCDAFYGTTLGAELERRGVTRLVVVGAETPYCLDTTVQRALGLDDGVVLAADAHTAGEGDGALSPAQAVAHHNVTLAELPHPTREVTVVPKATIVFR